MTTSAPATTVALPYYAQRYSLDEMATGAMPIVIEGHETTGWRPVFSLSTSTEALQFLSRDLDDRKVTQYLVYIVPNDDPAAAGFRQEVMESAIERDLVPVIRAFQQAYHIEVEEAPTSITVMAAKHAANPATSDDPACQAVRSA